MPHKPTVFVTRKLPDAIETRMRELFDTRLNLEDRPMTQSELIEAVQKADVLVPTVTDRIDSKVPREEQFSAIKSLIDDGVIRHAGLSEVTVEEIKAAQKVFKVATVQNRYNLAARASDHVLEHCERLGIGFIPWYPLPAGRLARLGLGGLVLRDAAGQRRQPLDHVRRRQRAVAGLGIAQRVAALPPGRRGHPGGGVGRPLARHQGPHRAGKSGHDRPQVALVQGPHLGGSPQFLGQQQRCPNHSGFTPLRPGLACSWSHVGFSPWNA